jgi:HPt (histidine-containing phosphotransfer) domain-containing protein
MNTEWKKLPRITVAVDPDLIDLIPDFMARKQTDVQNLKNALDGGDLATVASIGHKIKGEGGSFGFDTISDIGAGLESCGKQGDRASAQQLVSDLSEYLEKVEVVEGPAT